jgi:hypothetical protein
MGHDILGYGVLGKLLFEEKSLTPIWVTDFASNGFRYRTLHAPSFPLLLTWEKLINSWFQLKNDFFFISVSTYYGFLIIVTQAYWIAKKSKWLALISSYALVSGLGFFNLFFSRHLDSYRILFFCISLIYLALSIKKSDFLSLLMLGISSGFMTFAHRI